MLGGERPRGKSLQAGGTGMVLTEATGAESFPGRSEVVWDQARQLCSSSHCTQQDSPCGFPQVRRQQART